MTNSILIIKDDNIHKMQIKISGWNVWKGIDTTNKIKFLKNFGDQCKIQPNVPSHPSNEQ